MASRDVRGICDFCGGPCATDSRGCEPCALRELTPIAVGVDRCLNCDTHLIRVDGALVHRNGAKKCPPIWKQGEKLVMPYLTKTRTVLQAQGWVDGRMVFTPDEEDVAERSSRLHLDDAVYVDMGKPTTITVTVEPGDLLNACVGEKVDDE